MNFALRHPDVVQYCYSMSGAFDIKQFLDGYFDQDCYFNSPFDFLPQMSHMQVYRPRVRNMAVAPDLSEQRLSGKTLVRVRDEMAQQAELLRSELYPPAVAPQFLARQRHDFENRVVNGDRILPRRRFFYERADSPEDLARTITFRYDTGERLAHLAESRWLLA